MPPPVENAAAHALPQDLQYVDYDVVNGHPPPHEHRDHVNYVGVTPDVPAPAPAALPAPVCTALTSPRTYILPEPLPEENDIFDRRVQNAVAGPARALPGEWPPRGPLPNQPANEVLRQLAILYLREPNSQVADIRMEPSHAHGISVVITLELTDL